MFVGVMQQKLALANSEHSKPVLLKLGQLADLQSQGSAIHVLFIAAPSTHTSVGTSVALPT